MSPRKPTIDDLDDIDDEDGVLEEEKAQETDLDLTIADAEDVATVWLSLLRSLTHQAVQLGYFPRVTVRHTSHTTEGQIYIPELNGILMLACLAP